MTPRERYLTAISGGIPDRVPVGDYLFSPPLQQRILGYTTPLYDGASQVKLAHALGLDAIWVPINGFCGTEEEPHAEGTRYQDEWGVTYIKHGWPIMAQIDTPVKSRDDWRAYRLPPVAAPHRTRMLRDAIAANSACGLAMTAGFLGPFTMLYWYLMDLETLSFTLYDDPALVHEMNDAYTDWALAAAALAADLGGVDFFSISDDWGSTASLLMSPAQLREFFIPPMTRLVRGLRALGKPVLMHNDGRIWPMLDDLVNTGISALHPIERAAGGDLAFVKQRYLGRLCPIGNVDNKYTMTEGTPDAIRAEVLECLRIGMPGGGYVLSTDHSIHAGMPYENVMTYLETAAAHGAY
jgi:uroporphyrinogen decarboxylase